MKLCEYGCGQIATHQFKNGKWCCSNRVEKCPIKRLNMSKIAKERHGRLDSPYNEEWKEKVQQNSREKINEIMKSKEFREKSRMIQKEVWKNQELRNNLSKTMKQKWKDVSNKLGSKEHIQKMRESRFGKKILTIKYIQNKYPTFAKVEELRYNPDKPGEKELQVHCKNHNCSNSKENGGWFTPTPNQIQSRRDAIEYGNGGSYFYCCDQCKQECPLFNLMSDPLKDNKKFYTENEYQIWRKEVLNRAKYKCEYCGNKAEHVHHIKPQKLEPFFSLDPDYGLACCQECHYKYGHKTNTKCSTNNLLQQTCR